MHAIAYGTLTSYGSDSINHSEDEVSYNPYKFPYFYRKADNSPVTSLEAATFTDGRMFAGLPASAQGL